MGSNLKNRNIFAVIAGSAGLCFAANAYAAEPFSLTSSSFKDGTMLATKNAGNIKTNPNCIGENVSPPLAWSNVPPQRQESCADHDGP